MWNLLRDLRFPVPTMASHPLLRQRFHRSSICNALLSCDYHPDRRMMALSRLTLHLGDGINTHIAYELVLSREVSLRDSPHLWIRCDMCSSPVNFGGPFFICASYSDCALCHDCFPEYKSLDSPIVSSRTGSSGCLSHEFLAIPRKEWKDWDHGMVDSSGQTLTQWLVAMRDT